VPLHLALDHHQRQSINQMLSLRISASNPGTGSAESVSGFVHEHPEVSQNAIDPAAHHVTGFRSPLWWVDTFSFLLQLQCADGFRELNSANRRCSSSLEMLAEEALKHCRFILLA
jgi:hypothetical protein